MLNTRGSLWEHIWAGTTAGGVQESNDAALRIPCTSRKTDQAKNAAAALTAGKRNFPQMTWPRKDGSPFFVRHVLRSNEMLPNADSFDLRNHHYPSPLDTVYGTPGTRQRQTRNDLHACRIDHLFGLASVWVLCGRGHEFLTSGPVLSAVDRLLGTAFHDSKFQPRFSIPHETRRQHVCLQPASG